jgi:hypothetical protein
MLMVSTHNKSPSNLLIVSLINAVARSFGLNVSFARITVRFNTREIICCLISKIFGVLLI